jgi:minor capsid protein
VTFEEEFAQLMEDLGLGTYQDDGSSGGTIFSPLLPSTPDRCVAIATYGGPESAATDDYDEPSVQLRFRGPAGDARLVKADAQNAYDKLHALGSRELAGGTWLQDCIGNQSGPIFIGVDGNNRPEYTVNLRCEISRPSPNRSNRP